LLESSVISPESPSRPSRAHRSTGDTAPGI
jgi:hypothetical protein